MAVIAAFYAASWYLAQVDLGKLATGIPKIGYWLAQAWPPKLDELPLFLLRTGETVAMAAIGTTMAVLLAIPMAVLGSRNITPFPRLYHPVRWFLNALRGIDSFVFALLFVAAVGLGPFAGVLGHRAAHLGQRGEILRRPHREAPTWGRSRRCAPPAPADSPPSPTRWFRTCCR